MIVQHEIKDLYALEAFAKFEDMAGQKIDSLAHNKNRKTDSTVVEFRSSQGEICYARIKVFLKAGNKGICVCHLLDTVNITSPFSVCGEQLIESISDIDMKESNKTTIKNIIETYKRQNVVRHQICVKPHLGKVILLNVQQIIRKCVFVDILQDCWIISRFPNIVEHN